MCGIIYESSNDDPTKQNKYTLESNTDSGGRIWQWKKILGTKYRTKRTLKWEKKKTINDQKSNINIFTLGWVKNKVFRLEYTGIRGGVFATFKRP